MRDPEQGLFTQIVLFLKEQDINTRILLIKKQNLIKTDPFKYVSQFCNISFNRKTYHMGYRRTLKRFKARLVIIVYSYIKGESQQSNEAVF